MYCTLSTCEMFAPVILKQKPPLPGCAIRESSVIEIEADLEIEVDVREIVRQRSDHWFVICERVEDFPVVVERKFLQFVAQLLPFFVSSVFPIGCFVVKHIRKFEDRSVKLNEQYSEFLKPVFISWWQ
jgi:hypothetical protein